VRLFADARRPALCRGAEKAPHSAQQQLNAMSYKLPAEFDTDVQAALEDWRQGRQSQAPVGCRRIAVDRTGRGEMGSAGWALSISS